jgi:hypothetical protein
MLGAMGRRPHAVVAVLCGLASAAGADPPCGPTEEPTPQFFLVLAAGMGGVSRLADAAPGQAMTFGLQFGQRLGRRLHLVEELDVLDSFPYTPDLSISEDHATFLMGVRWAPFRADPRRVGGVFGPAYDATAFFVKGTVGAGFRERRSTTTDVTHWTPIVAAHLGWTPWRGRDWAFGWEFREELGHYAEGFQRDWAFIMLAELRH